MDNNKKQPPKDLRVAIKSAKKLLKSTKNQQEDCIEDEERYLIKAERCEDDCKQLIIEIAERKKKLIIKLNEKIAEANEWLASQTEKCDNIVAKAELRRDERVAEFKEKAKEAAACALHTGCEVGKIQGRIERYFEEAELANIDCSDL